MRQIFLSLFCLAFAGGLLAQEKYPAPTLTVDQKFNRSVYQYWALTAAAISQAKANGISPYNYGKSIGREFAPTWGDPGFDGFVKGLVWNFESWRGTQEKRPVAKENQDGSVTLTIDDKSMHGIFSNTLLGVSYDEFLDYSKGIMETFASDIINGKCSFVHQDSVLVATIRRE